MSKVSNFQMNNPSLNSLMIEDAYEIMDKIEKLESIELDEASSTERRKAAAKEKAFQEKDLKNLKSLMKNSRNGFTRIIYYKYIEGYTLEEVAQEVNLAHSTVANIHASFTTYLKNPSEHSFPNLSKGDKG